MRANVGITDYDWFSFLSNRPDLDEVNFWKPGGKSGFRALEPGGLFLFKLHALRHFIVGGGYFAHFSRIKGGGSGRRRVIALDHFATCAFFSEHGPITGHLSD
jgi:hypothetical protein